MIFVTVGTTKFEALIKEADALARAGVFDQEIVFQIGAGVYEPSSGEFFRFLPNIDHYLASADLVITHGGSTVLNMLGLNKRFVAIANTQLADDHQSIYLRHLQTHTPLLWSREVSELGTLIEEALNSPPPSLDMPPLAMEIDRLITDLC